MSCPRCASPIEDPQARFCPICGASVVEPPSMPVEAAPPTATADKGLATARCATHPDAPAADICVRCGAFACTACLIIGSDGTVTCQKCWEREGGAQTSLPWERRKELGFWKAYWQTTRAVMFRPGDAFDGFIPATGNWWDPISYSIVSLYFAMSGTTLFQLAAAIVGLAVKLARPDSSTNPFQSALPTLGMAAVSLVTPVLGLGYVFVMSGLEHLTLRLLGVQTRGFEATVRAYCFSQAPMFWGVIPSCGAYLYLVWGVVCRTFGYKAVHKTTTGKAVAGVLLPTLLAVGGMVVAIAAAAFMNKL